MSPSGQDGERGSPKGLATFVDGEERRRIRDDHSTTLFVEAAAGTGKTRALIGRMVSLLAAGAAEVIDIVALTFTEKAAGEMKLRLRSEIEAARSSSASPHLDRAVSQLELARVGTIHAFCADLLRERPVEAGVDPLFEVAPEDEAQRLLDEAFGEWFERILENPPEGVRRVLRRRASSGDGARSALRMAVGTLADHRDFPAAWLREPFERESAIDRLMAELESVGELTDAASWKDDYLARSTGEIQRFVSENALREGVRGRDYDALEAELRDLARARSWRWRGSPRKPFGKNLPRQTVLAKRDAARSLLDQTLAATEADLAPLLHAELRPVVESYEELKRRRGVLDFLDLLVRARDLLHESADVRREMQARYSHFFVDEFQDTDPLQAEILLLLAAEDGQETDWRRAAPVAGKLFFVGDPKQAIYRFRRADIAIYQEVKDRLVGFGAEVLHLRTSFRSQPAIQQLVNASFAPLMNGDDPSSQAEYVALEPHRPTVTEQPAVVALPVPQPYAEWGKMTKGAIESSFPSAVGAFVDWLVRESGWTIESGGRRVPIEARHVCLLFRRFKHFRSDVTREYVRALEIRQLPHVLVGGRSFHDREEVLAVRNALNAIEWPDDELRVFATLRGPLFAFGDDALLAFRGRVGRLHPLRRFNVEDLDQDARDVVAALSILSELHYGRNRRPIAQTITRFLAAVRAHAGLAIWPTGEQALANCLRTVDLAARFEARGARSFRAFVERLEADAERATAEEAPAVEEGTEGVRVMTVHRAKGLEFPVVILADPTCNLARTRASRHVDAQRGLWTEPLCGCVPIELVNAQDEEHRREVDEAVRIAYVAATRARDLLVVPVVGDPRSEEIGAGWLGAVEKAVYPAEEDRRSPGVAPGCPVFGGDSVFERPLGSDREAVDSVAPGLHKPQAGEHRVVWWDPSRLDLECDQDLGLRQQSILEADENGAVEKGTRAHDVWQQRRRTAHEAGVVESLRARPVSALVDESAVDEEGGILVSEFNGTAVEILETAAVPVGDSPRRGAAFGTLVHSVLAAIPFESDAAGVEELARLNARVMGLGADDAEHAARRVLGALEHELLRRAARCRGDALRREVPLAVRLQSGVLAEGVADLVFRPDDAGWIVVDFKTDVDLQKRRAEYERQIAIYCAAIRRATGAPARGVLLRV